MPNACNAQPVIFNLPSVITVPLAGDSKLLFASK